MCLAIPGRVLETYDRDALPMGRVEFGGVKKEICLAYVPEATIGDYVLVHVGFAISTVDEEEAEDIFATIEQMEALDDLAEIDPKDALPKDSS